MLGPRNKFEKEIAQFLKKKKVRFSYETEKLPYQLNLSYTPDFIITTRSGKKVYIETKGRFKYEDRRKMAAIKEANPELDIRIVFYNSRSKIAKGSVMTYGDWGTKYGYIWSDKVIPMEWLSE